MGRDVKPKRRYDSPLRREQAAGTRGAILDAAARLFERQGYVKTSVAAIAAEAGVAVKTVYAVFGTKRAVLMGLRSRLIRGDDEAIPIAERQWFRDLADERDPSRRIELLVRHSRLMKERAGPLFEIIRHAAPVDPEIGLLWRRFMQDFHENQRLIVEQLDREGALAGDVEQATDVLWTLNHPSIYHLLVTERGWNGDAYERWLADTLRTQLLAGRATRSRSPAVAQRATRRSP